MSNYKDKVQRISPERLAKHILKNHINDRRLGMEKWIRIEDKSPADRELVWLWGRENVYDDKSVIVGYLDINHNITNKFVYKCTCHDSPVYGVTHWMRIEYPKPPEVKGE